MAREPEGVLLIGIQGAGKSTFCREHFYDTHVRLNLDMLRTRQRERRLIEACIAARQSFVVDNTSPSPEDRQRYIALLRPAGFRVVGYYLQSSAAAALGRLEGRPRQVPLPAVVGTARRLVPPSFEEGFDALHAVHIAEGSTPGQPRFVVSEICRSAS